MKRIRTIRAVTGLRTQPMRSSSRENFLGRSYSRGGEVRRCKLQARIRLTEVSFGLERRCFGGIGPGMAQKLPR